MKTLAHRRKRGRRHPINNDAQFLAGACKCKHPDAAWCVVSAAVCAHVILAAAHVRHPIVAQTIATLREYRLRRHPTAVGDRSRRTLQKYQMHFTMCVIYMYEKSFDAKYTPRASMDRTPDWRREDSGSIRQRTTARMTSDS